MSARVTAAERAALPVARKALESKASGYGISDAIVFALGAAGLLADAEVAQAVAGLKADELAPGAYVRMRSALGVMQAARRQHGEGLVPLVWALEAAGLLQSPETAAELVALRALVERLTAAERTASEMVGEQGERITELEKQVRAVRKANSEQHDDLVHALGRDGTGTEWADLIDMATGYMRTAEGLEKAKDERVAELVAEAERHGRESSRWAAAENAIERAYRKGYNPDAAELAELLDTTEAWDAS